MWTKKEEAWANIGDFWRRVEEAEEVQARFSSPSPHERQLLFDSNGFSHLRANIHVMTRKHGEKKKHAAKSLYSK